MAARQQKGRTSKNSSAKRGTKKKTQSKSKDSGIAFRGEITLLIILALCILLFISNFGIGGVVGETFSGFFFGVFGLMAYVLPVCIFVGAAFYMSNRHNRVAVVKLAAVILFVLFLCLFIELVVTGNARGKITDSYTYGVENKSGGGIIGGALANLLCMAFGLIGAYVVDIIILIICLVLITERSFLGGVRKGSKKVYDTAREDAQRYREHVEKKREEREQMRLDKKVEGVAVDTKIVPPVLTAADGLSELKPETQAPPFTKHAMEKLFPETPKKEPAEPELVPVRTEIVQPITERITEETEPSYEPITTYETDDFSEGDTELPDLESLFPTEEEMAYRNPKKDKEQIVEDVDRIEEEIHTKEPPRREYIFPPTSLLKPGGDAQGDSQKHLQETALKLQQILKNFGVNVTITDVSRGPAVTRYEIQPEMGVKVSKIVNLSDDIKLNLEATDIRIEAPIPGKAAVGIEVPNKEKAIVRFRDMVESSEFKKHTSGICFTAGKDISGQVVVADIAKMPHLLIAGSTGSGKSVCINTIIMSILYKADPENVKMILIDPKVVELSVYNGIPHLFIPVVTDPKKAAGALHWAVSEMDERYKKFAEYQVRDLKGYNQKVEAIQDIEDETKPKKLPQIVIIVDELADLMMVAPGDVEDAICRLAQLARAAGIHLIIATQRPSVDVITGLIKANMPSRIAFAVSSGVDSRTILDMNGAEKLLGNGDMLFYPQGYPKPVRVQGPFVSDPEVEAVVDFLKKQSTAVYSTEIEEKVSSAASSGGSAGGGSERDEYFVDAGKFVIEKDKGSIGMLQRWFKIGFNRAARIMDQLEEAGVVGPEEGTKPRRILMSMEQFEEYVDEYV